MPDGVSPVAVRPKQEGVTLIELVVFIVVIAIAVTGVLTAFAATQRGGPTSAQMGVAEQIAQERMELMLAQRPLLGFDCFNVPLADPCQNAAAAPPCPGRTASTASICTTFPVGFVVTSNVSAVAGTAEKDVTVQVVGPQGQQLAALTSEVDRY